MDYHFDSMEDIKLIILTVIDNFNMPITNAMIVDTVLEHSFAEYIDIMQYLHELTESKMVTYYFENDTRYYSLTEKGKDAVTFFSSKIPFTVRERLYETAKQNAKAFLNDEAVRADYEKANDFEYNVILRIVERGVDMFFVKLTIGSESAAKAMCEGFKRDPQTLYTTIFSLLLDSKGEN